MALNHQSDYMDTECDRIAQPTFECFTRSFTRHMLIRGVAYSHVTEHWLVIGSRSNLLT